MFHILISLTSQPDMRNKEKLRDRLVVEGNNALSMLYDNKVGGNKEPKGTMLERG